MTNTLIQALVKRTCYTISPDKYLIDVIKKLADNKIGALPVVNSNGFLEGIISERDIIKEIHLHRKMETRKVEEAMTKKIITCSLQARANEIMELMTANKIRHIPIVNDKELLGMVSIGDVVSRLLTKYKSEADLLKNYINS